MDSLTQIVLGAAMGEAAAGKKIGNRAMLWGAIGGTIPDMDVFAKFFMKEIDSLAFHRGFMHSISFAILGTFVFGWLVHRFYESNYHRKIILFVIGVFVFFAGFLFIENIDSIIGLVKTGIVSIVFLIILLILSALVFIRLRSPYNRPEATLRDWQKVFFWSILTHPLLDSYTVYGTQLFQPFSNYRVAFNNISIVDPGYTIPFLICVIIVMILPKRNKWRSIINWIGIGISSIYMLFTLVNKYQVSQVFKNTMTAQEQTYTRYMTSPTILNNILWNCCAESDSTFILGQYSFFDQEEEFKTFQVDKNHQLLGEVHDDDHILNTLKWFSNNYYSIIEREDGKLQFNDLRYSTFGGEGMEENDFIFKFIINKDKNGYYQLVGSQGGPPRDKDAKQLFNSLMKRMKGV